MSSCAALSVELTPTLAAAAAEEVLEFWTGAAGLSKCSSISSSNKLSCCPALLVDSVLSEGKSGDIASSAWSVPSEKASVS